jgi:hypothetical protein
VQRSSAGTLGLELFGNSGRFELELRGDWKEDGAKLLGLLRAERRGVRVQVGASGQPAAGARWRPYGRLELDGRGFLFWFSAGGGDAGREVSLGWSASQPLLKSPTVSTSRSRR